MPRLLLIDDDQPLRRALRLALEKSGHTVVEANDGRAALKAHQAQPVDLVITDLIMPEMEGVELIRSLRKSNPALPIIAMSGGGRSSPESYLAMAKQFGAALLLTKPFSLDKLCESVAQLLDGHSKPVPTAGTQ